MTNYKKVQLYLRPEVEAEKQVIDALEAAGRNSGLAKQWIIAGFLQQQAYTAKPKAVEKPKTAAKSFGSLVGKG